MNSGNTLRLATTVTLTLLIIGCKTSDPLQVEDDFGKSVRTMVESQIYVPDQQDENTETTELDGDTAVNVVEQYVDKSKKTQTVNNVPARVLPN